MAATDDQFFLSLVWKCLRCGELQHGGQSPPDACPSCGGPKEEFELVEED